jgi:hypothetical protein
MFYQIKERGVRPWANVILFQQINEEKEPVFIVGLVVWHFAKLRVSANATRRKTTKNVKEFNIIQETYSNISIKKHYKF